MSDHIVQSHNDSDDTPRKSMHPYQSAWMAHWTHTSSKFITQAHNQPLLQLECKKNDHAAKLSPLVSGSNRTTDGSKVVKEFREVNKPNTTNLTNQNLETRSEILRNGRSECPNFPQISDNSCLAVKNVETTNHEEGVLSSQIGLNSGYDATSLGGNENDFMQSSSKIVPYGFESRTPMKSFMGKQVNHPSSLVASKGHFMDTSYKCYSSQLVNDNNTNGLLNSERAGPETLSRQNDAGLLPCDPSTSNNQPLDIVGKRHQMMQNSSGIASFAGSENLLHGCYFLPNVKSVHGVETMRICATVDSIKELSRGPSKLSQTTHHFLITKKTDVNLSDRGQLDRESKVTTKIKGKTVGELLSLSPKFDCNVRQGLQLQPLESSAESDGKEKVKYVKTSEVNLKNESSAETDTMDIDVFQENSISGVASSLSNKDIKWGQMSPTPQAEIALDREDTGGRLLVTELPDMNQECPALSGLANSLDAKETSSSRTQSLDVDHLLSHAEQPTNSNSVPRPDGTLEPDASYRWVKRLKSGASDAFAHGTKNSKIGEASSHENVNEFFRKIMKCSKTSSEPKMDKFYGKIPITLDRPPVLLKNGETSYTDSVRENQDITLAHFWIQRWCHKQTVSQQKKPKAVVVCEPQSSKAATDELQNKQFPSIAAMALMGKAMNGFHPCEFRNKGSLVVWNTKKI